MYEVGENRGPFLLRVTPLPLHNHARFRFCAGGALGNERSCRFLRVQSSTSDCELVTPLLRT